MYERGEYVVYRRTEVCRVADVAGLRDAGAGCVYYHLRPLSYEGMIYVPVAEQTGLRPLIGGDEARRLLGALGELAAPVSHARDRRALEQHYQELMRPGTCAALARTLKSLYAKHLDAAHRRLSAPEEQLMRQTELTLCEELALALGRSEADVRAQLRRALGAERTA